MSKNKRDEILKYFNLEVTDKYKRDILLSSYFSDMTTEAVSEIATTILNYQAEQNKGELPEIFKTKKALSGSLFEMKDKNLYFPLDDAYARQVIVINYLANYLKPTAEYAKQQSLWVYNGDKTQATTLQRSTSEMNEEKVEVANSVGFLSNKLLEVFAKKCDDNNFDKVASEALDYMHKILPFYVEESDNKLLKLFGKDKKIAVYSNYELRTIGKDAFYETMAKFERVCNNALTKGNEQ